MTEGYVFGVRCVGITFIAPLEEPLVYVEDIAEKRWPCPDPWFSYVVLPQPKLQVLMRNYDA